jgi:hypothetical protein
MAGNAQLLGTYPAFSTMTDPGVNGSGTVLGNPLRFGRVDDPKGNNRKVFRHAMKIGDPFTAGNVYRVDVMPPNNTVEQDVVYWLAWDMLLPSNTYFANDDQTLVNVHPGNSGGSATWQISSNRYNGGSGMTYIRATAGAGPLVVQPISQNNAPPDTWLKVVAKFRLSSTSSGFATVWINGVQVVNDSGPNTAPGSGDYVKMAFYQVSDFTDSSRSEREMFYGQMHIVRDAGHTFEQISTLLK